MTNSSIKTKLDHLVLQIQKDQLTLQFYQEFLSLLGYKKDMEMDNYQNYSNQILSIGLYFEDSFEELRELSSGLGHLAWKVENKVIYHDVVGLLQKYKLEIETINQIKKHYNKEFYTLSFYCPSGNRFEIIL